MRSKKGFFQATKLRLVSVVRVDVMHLKSGIKIVPKIRAKFKFVGSYKFMVLIYGSITDIDDMVISNNGDSEKVLTTVVATLYAFTDKYPDAWIYATGSTKARTRLYRIGITKFLSEVTADFEVLGERNDDWETFKKNVEYEGFLVRRK